MLRVPPGLARNGVVALAFAPALALAGCNEGDRTASDEATDEGALEQGETAPGSSSGEDNDDGGERLDIAGGGEAGGDGGGQCGCGLSGRENSYIWIAHPGQGTISKINTRTLEIEGRYQTSPNANGDPSRTSVSLNGDVAVANRSNGFGEAGVTKFYGTPERCAAALGKRVSELNTSRDDVALPWDQEECRAWHVPFTTTSNRPVAWTGGEQIEGSCEYAGELLWTAYIDDLGGGSRALLLDGDDGSTVEEVHLQDYSGGTLGPYGGAVDSKGNFWMVGNTAAGLPDPFLVMVPRDDPQRYRKFPLEGGLSYGITVDHNDRVWVTNPFGGMMRFDLQTTTWRSGGAFGSGGGGGAAEDAKGRVWFGGNGQVQSVNSVSMMPDTTVNVGGGMFINGLSTDVDGNVWGVGGTSAYRVNPETGDVDEVAGLPETYTYSDMTGVALHGVSCPAAG